MLIKEFRIVMPLSVEEYQIGQLYSIAEASLNETGGGEGIEVLKNEPFENASFLGGKYTSGQFTHKIYHIASKVPSLIRVSAPKGSLEIHEHSWNAFPYCRTVISNPTYMKQNFVIIIESLHLPDRGQAHNALNLTAEKLHKREVILIDIANDPLHVKSDYKENQDPTKFVSEQTGRGKLGKDWINTSSPVMTAYKLVTVEFKWFGLQSRVESFVQRSERRLFTIFHRQLFCWMDRWYGMNLDDIREYEARNKAELDRMRATGQKRGMRASITQSSSIGAVQSVGKVKSAGKVKSVGKVKSYN